MAESPFYLDTSVVFDYIIEDNSDNVMDFINEAKRNAFDLYASELAVYEAIPILLQEEYFRTLGRLGPMKSIRRAWKKITRESRDIPVEVRKELIPKVKNFRDTVTVLDFDQLPGRVHKNAQNLALTSKFDSYDALHIAISLYLAETLDVMCYIVSEDEAAFNETNFERSGSEFVSLAGLVKPLTPGAAYQLVRRGQ